MVYTKEIELLQNFALPNEVEMKKCVHKQDKIKNRGKFFLKTHEQMGKNAANSAVPQYNSGWISSPLVSD